MSSQFGNKKGFVFALDAAFAVVVFILLLLAIRYYATGFHKNTLPDIQTVRVGSDILAVLDYTGTLNTLNKNTIENKMEDLLPPNYEMKIIISGESSHCDEEAGAEDIPDDRFVASGKRFLAAKPQTTTYYCTARYWIWLK